VGGGGWGGGGVGGGGGGGVGGGRVATVKKRVEGGGRYIKSPNQPTTTSDPEALRKGMERGGRTFDSRRKSRGGGELTN